MPGNDPPPILDYATPPARRPLHRGWWGVALALWVIGFGGFVFVFVAVGFLICAGPIDRSTTWTSLELVASAVVALVTAVATRRLLHRIEPATVIAISLGLPVLALVVGMAVAGIVGGEDGGFIFGIAGAIILPAGFLAMICGLLAVAAARRAERG